NENQSESRHELVYCHERALYVLKFPRRLKHHRSLLPSKVATTNSTPAVASQNPALLKKKKKSNKINTRNSDIISTKPDKLAALLTSLPCSSPSHLDQIHAHLLRSPLPPSSLFPAFDRAVHAVSKTKPILALRLYLLMTRAALRPGRFTLPFLLNSAAAIPLPSAGAELHSRALRSGLLSFLPVANALIDMYSKCRALHLARQAFDEMPLRDVVSHNALLGGYARLGVDMPAARRLFDEMPERNVISWNAMVVGYANAGDLAAARDVFDKMPVRNVVSWTVMVLGYCKVGSVDAALALFEAMPERNLVSWTAMITGFSQCGRAQEALALFHEMEREGLEPDAAAMVGVISAAAQLGRAELANWVASYVNYRKIERNERVLTALVDMHAKCGNVDEASSLFDEISSPDAYAYTALINGLASHGHGRKALEIFQRMQVEAIEPDPITFVGVLSACSHAGLVDEGLFFWESMVRDFGMERGPDHYACVVDMLGRAGRLEEAHEMVKRMPMGPHAGSLGALLAACRTYSNVDIAENVAEELFKLEPDNTGNYILLSSIYAAREQWADAARVRAIMRGKRISKFPGYSWTEDKRRGHIKLQTMS
ncbi:pentatricopeptide repeat-containing protein At3g29230-like, partial [Phoenix dactylifera]|uniref:Pentatricopeptide repeat-containing protein At3g29230-like n=1 Tax=Phoenix dactylifera TaxID=42345 RepID=A0A8B9AJI0_PHODC